MNMPTPGRYFKACRGWPDESHRCNRTLISAYAGWGNIAGQETNTWFAKVIKPFVDSDQLREGTLEVARRATAYFARPRYPPIPPEQKRHTFIGVGWQQRRRNGHTIPVAVRITNAFDDQHQPLDHARRDFVVQKVGLQRLSGIKVLETGGYIDKKRLLTLGRYLRRAYYLCIPLLSAKLLAKELRSLSDKPKDNCPVHPVRKNLIVTCLPKVAAL
jgi:hypothetical protein